MSCGVVVEGMDRARRATLNFFTETLRGTHRAPADIMDLLMVAKIALELEEAGRSRAVPGITERAC